MSDFVERRRKTVDCDTCPEHGELSTTITIVKTNLANLIETVGKIEKHLENAATVRMGWWMAVAGIIMSVLIQTAVFCYWLGQISRQIEVDTSRIAVIEGVVFKK